MKNKYKMLAKNSILFAMANFGSKLLKFVIVPLYTYCLTTTEYGTVDILTTTVSLLAPFLLLGLNEAVLRYSMNPDYTPSEVFSNCISVFALMSVICCFLSSVFNEIVIFQGYWWLFYFLLVLNSLESLLLAFLKGIGCNKQFAFAGILNTVVLLTSNIILLVYMKMGIRGYLYSMILGYFSSILFILASVKVYKYFSVSLCNFRMIKILLKYSFPLMPNAIMWWIMNASDRYVILWFLGEAAAGIYAVAYKIPSILSVLTSIFHQAWQISAIQEDGANDKKVFYGSVFSIYSELLILASSIVIMFIKPLIVLVTQIEYHSAWKYVPFLALGALFSGMCSFEGINYTVSGKTIGAFTTSVMGAIINTVLNIILTPYLGLQGTAIATFVGYYILWLVRARETRRLKRYDIDYKKIHISLLLLIIQAVVLIIDLKGQIIIQLVMFLLLLLNNRMLLRGIGNLAKRVKGM